MGEALAGKKTAKRRIQIREFITKQTNSKKVPSTPFIENEDENFEAMCPKPLNFTFKTDYIRDAESDDSDERDDILTARVNLDDADRFISALKIPRKRVATRSDRERRVAANARVTPLDLSAFKATSERVAKILAAETTGECEEEDDNLI